MANPYPDPMAVIALIGPDGVGKSTLLQDVARMDPHAAPHGVQVNGLSATVIDLRTPTRTVQLVDFADASTEAALLGASRFAGVVLVVSAADSVMPGHKQSLERARHLGIPLAAIALTKTDVVPDEELQDLVEMELRELANKYSYPGDQLRVVRMRPRSTCPHEGREPRPGKPQGPQALLHILAR